MVIAKKKINPKEEKHHNFPYEKLEYYTVHALRRHGTARKTTGIVK